MDRILRNILKKKKKKKTLIKHWVFRIKIIPIFIFYIYTFHLVIYKSKAFCHSLTNPLKKNKNKKKKKHANIKFTVE